ncbi:Mco6p Ecym_5210 [Eremothecium cymbalariae DBVPG|uniref:Uncharacterized protein n=1 Tax=Eremothecium cymbalariae (strain CBS 270.75 / DBVPG 7215 / KCTC 17166 / NRRL Y-17582) TaxID=931890 RepID=I6ND37_ERECY|nr:hypothetical protein Ecym_5210 [Eremothecium cymbalariae DBVPG\
MDPMYPSKQKHLSLPYQLINNLCLHRILQEQGGTLKARYSVPHTYLVSTNPITQLPFTYLSYLSKPIPSTTDSFYNMINFFRQIRNIFRESHTSLQQIILSRRAFFQLLGYLGTCTLLTVMAQNL